MRWVSKVPRAAGHPAIWRAMKPTEPVASGRWFVGRFLDASSVVVRRWGPAWVSQRSLLGRELGVWILAALWLTVPVAMALKCIRRFFW